MATDFSFRPRWLEEDEGFTWRSALGLVTACKAAYLPSDHAVNLAKTKWFMDAEAFEVGDSQGLILENSEVTVVAFRGTDSTADWLSNLRIKSRRVPDFGGSLHSGFLNAYDVVAPIVDLAVQRSEGRKLWFTGHSLGGALAVIAALTHRESTITGLMTFGQPRLLGRRTSKFMDSEFGKKYNRFINRNDIVTRVPPGYRHTGLRRHFTGLDNAFDDPMVESSDAVADESITQLNEAEFEAMQQQINQVSVQVKEYAAANIGTEDFDATEEELLEASVEGLIPGLSAHKIDAYLAEVNGRAASEISLHGVHETFQERRSAQFNIETTFAAKPAAFEDVFFSGAEEAGLDIEALPTETAGADGEEEEGTYLVRLATQVWTPPAGVTLRSLVGNIASVSTTKDGVTKMSHDPMVLSVEASREAGVEDVGTSVPHVKGTAVHTNPTLPEKGEKALVGVIDTGIDILHEAFDDDAGNSRVVAVWLQRDKSGPTPKDIDPVAFSQDYGTLYLAKDIADFRAAFASDGSKPPSGLRDEFSGHGTHVASIAAGRAFSDIGPGMAPAAGIIVVSAHTSSDPDNPEEPRSIGYSSSHVDALAFLKRVSQGSSKVSNDALPMAINVSLGMNAGAHDGQTTLEAAFDGITGGGRDPGLIIVKSAGNERNHKGHASAQAALGGAVDIKWETDGNARQRDYLEAWFQPGDDIEFALVSPFGDRVGPVNFEQPDAQMTSNGNHYRLTLSEGHSDNGHNRLTISVERQQNDILPGTWCLEMVGRQVFSRDAMVHIWAERVRQRSIQFLDPDRKMTLSVPGTANSIVTVGACSSSFPMKLLDMSSLGLTRDGRPKPELCAPGEMITAASAGGATDAAVNKTGTSMAAPHVTGAVALVFSARVKAGMPQVNAVQLQQRLRLTTQNFSPIHNPGFGSGILDAEKLLSELT